ncbi:uncharacterized protein [Dysidea avara]|uniref:uncharacterized protein n=1 Tax=Dysidea avara TaxID=196820 RepID=UPI00331B0E11
MQQRQPEKELTWKQELEEARKVGTIPAGVDDSFDNKFLQHRWTFCCADFKAPKDIDDNNDKDSVVDDDNNDKQGSDDVAIVQKVCCEEPIQGLKVNEQWYQVDLPWNRDKQELADFYQLCYNCEKSLQQRLINQSDVLQQYHSVIQEQLEKGIVEESTICHDLDIEKAFSMIGINKYDQDCLRFLWFENPHDTNSKLIHVRFTRLVFGLKPSPAILGAVIEKHVHNYQNQYPEIVNVMQNSLYVDD